MSAAISATRTLITGFVLIVIILLSSLLTTPITDVGKVRIALIQGGVSNLGLDFNSTPQEVFKRHLLQTTKSIKADEVDLIVWPENAVDIDVNTIPGVADQITNLSKSLKTPILIGGVTKSLTGPQNQSILFNPDKQQVYTKRYLTPFGEYLPLRNLSTRFSKYADEITDFSAGKNDLVFQVNSLKFQTQICYEIINDSFRDQVNSDFLIVQTNNATFGDTAQLDQELNIAKVRALETGREVAYVSTTGVTSFIDIEGKVRMSLPKFSPASLIDEVKMVKGQTYTQKYGKYLESLSIIVLLAILLIRKRVRR
jgi:apolipoprotein N-acyltransferase